MTRPAPVVGDTVLHSQPTDPRRSRWTVAAVEGWHVTIARGTSRIMTTVWAVEVVR